MNQINVLYYFFFEQTNVLIAYILLQGCNLKTRSNKLNGSMKQTNLAG